MDKGLEILSEVRKLIGVPVLTDVHAEDEIAAVAAAVDVLQTPAFLCRQTDFIYAVAASGLPVNIKKGQFLAPGDMKNVVDKARQASGRDNIMVCERGATFGYNNLISDMRSLAIMRDTGCPVVFDATHSVQLPVQAKRPSLTDQVSAAGVPPFRKEVQPVRSLPLKSSTLALGAAAAAAGAVVAGASAAMAKGEARTDEKIAAQRGRRERGDMG